MKVLAQYPSANKELPRWGAPALLLFQCLCSAVIGMYALHDTENLHSLVLLLGLPILIFRASNACNAFLIALTYYLVGARAVPEIIKGFFPGLSWGECILIWSVHACVLALIWAVAFAPRTSGIWKVSLRVSLAFVILSIPPIGLFHWGSPLLSAGLFFPGFAFPGILLLAILCVALITYQKRSIVHVVTVSIILSISIIANVLYTEPEPPQDWKGVSLQFGKGPGLWSDQMQYRRENLADLARTALADGARVIVFPESVSGSNIRSQESLWRTIAVEADERGSTILLGQETWDKERTGFKNALIGFGRGVEDNTVVVSSLVPMPMGEWKFGFEKGAQTALFSSDIIELGGKSVSFSMCYEDFLLWPHRGLLTGQADLFISVANQWPSSGTSSEVFQDTSRQSLARMAGVPLIVAKNR